jgi:hypothetical protein
LPQESLTHALKLLGDKQTSAEFLRLTVVGCASSRLGHLLTSVCRYLKRECSGNGIPLRCSLVLKALATTDRYSVGPLFLLAKRCSAAHYLSFLLAHDALPPIRRNSYSINLSVLEISPRTPSLLSAITIVLIATICNNSTAELDARSFNKSSTSTAERVARSFNKSACLDMRHQGALAPLVVDWVWGLNRAARFHQHNNDCGLHELDRRRPGIASRLISESVRFKPFSMLYNRTRLSRA